MAGEYVLSAAGVEALAAPTSAARLQALGVPVLAAPKSTANLGAVALEVLISVREPAPPKARRNFMSFKP